MATSQDHNDQGRPAIPTPSGREASRRNAMTHGLSGSGKLIPVEDVAEVDRRAAAYVRDLAVGTEMGRDLAHQMAVMSVRMDRCASHEAMAIAHARRHATDRHDDARQEEVEVLFARLGEDPRSCLRRLMRMPEGLQLLVNTWKGLRAELTRESGPRWTTWHRERAENLTGNRSDQVPYTEIGDLSDEIWATVAKDPKAEEAARALGRTRMIGRIDAEIAALENHHATLDHDMFELDRLEAPDRAVFQDTKAASLARRYEAEASRRFFKLMKQLQAIEAEASARPPVPATPTPAPSPSISFREIPRQEPYAPLGGFGGTPSATDDEEFGDDGEFEMMTALLFGSSPALK